MSTEAMRKSFEKWFTENDSPEMAALALELDSFGEYKFAATYHAWRTWQAATANQEALIKAALDVAAEVADVCDIQGEPYNAEQKIRQITPQQVMERMK